MAGTVIGKVGAKTIMEHKEYKKQIVALRGLDIRR